MSGAGYPFITAYLKGEESKVLTADHINVMAKASSIDDLLMAIRETDIGSYLVGASTQTFDEVDESLWNYLGDRLGCIQGFKHIPVEVHKILETYVVKYDVFNMKAALQGLLTGKKARSIPLGLIHSDKSLDSLLSAQNVDSIVDLVSKCKLGSYTTILQGYKTDEGVKSAILTEVRLDEEYYKNLINVTKNLKDGPTLTKVIGILIDMVNLKVIFRAVIDGTGVKAGESIIAGGYVISGEVAKELLSLKLADIPGRLANTIYHDVASEIVNSYSTKSIRAVDEIIDKYQFQFAKELLAPRVLSPLVIVWYLILKEVEIRNLRLILKAMFNNIPLEEIKMYLVLPS